MGEWLNKLNDAPSVQEAGGLFEVRALRRTFQLRDALIGLIHLACISAWFFPIDMGFHDEVGRTAWSGLDSHTITNPPQWGNSLLLNGG
jgi:hypothetical protein